MKTKPVYNTLKDENGKIVAQIPVTEADDDWMRAARFSRKAKQGDKEAEEELRKMENTPMVELDEEDDQPCD